MLPVCSIEMIVAVFCMLSSFICVGTSYQILGVFPLQIKSHYAVIEPLLARLAERGHNVTVYSHFPKKEAKPNYNEIDISECFEFKPEGIEGLAPLEGHHFLTVAATANFNNFTVETIEKCAPVKALFNSTDEYDLFITESFHSDTMLLLSNKLQIPTITFIPNSLVPWLADRMGNPMNPSYMPDMMTGYSAKMTFFQRTENTLLYLLSLFLYYTFTLSESDRVNKFYVGHSAPSLFKTVRNTDILFTNTHESLHPAIPLVPAVVPVGGIHIKPASALPKVRCSAFVIRVVWNRRSEAA